MTTGAAKIMIGPTGFNKVGSIEYGEDGNLYGATTGNDGSAPGSLILIDTSSGVATVVGATNYSITGLAETVPSMGEVGGPSVPVPTLSAWALIVFAMLIGLLGFSRLHRRV